MLLGAALALAVPAVLLAVVLEHVVLAPLTGTLAAGYADLAAGATTAQALAVAGGFLAFGVIAALRVARRVLAEPPVLGLREP